MKTKEILIKNLSGFEARTIAKLIQKASNFKSGIWIEKAERKANAKSLLGLLSLGIAKGETIVISAEGEDETEALMEIDNYINEL